MPNNADAARRWMLLAVVVLVTLNLRPFLTSPGPLLPQILADTGLGYGALSLMTLLPMLLMGAGAFFTPSLQALLGARSSILLALLVLATGCLLRLLDLGGVVFIATAGLCGIGVAIIQGVLPGLIKGGFPGWVAVVTGLYSALLMSGGAVGARIGPVLTGFGYTWREALAWLALPVLVAFVGTAIVMRDGQGTRPSLALGASLLRRRRTWTLMLAFGLMNAGYSSVVAWLAPHYHAEGWSAMQSADLLAFLSIVQALAALILPFLARGNRDRRLWIGLTLVLQAIGYAGFALAPLDMPLLWAASCGIGLGGCFSLTMVAGLDHLSRPEAAGALVAFMQGGGFILASFGPLAVALLSGANGGFAPGWIMHIGFVALAACIYLQFNPESYASVMQEK